MYSVRPDSFVIIIQFSKPFTGQVFMKAKQGLFVVLAVLVGSAAAARGGSGLLLAPGHSPADLVYQH